MLGHYALGEAPLGGAAANGDVLSAGTFALTGMDLGQIRIMALDHGSFALAGQDAGLITVSPLLHGSFALTGYSLAEVDVDSLNTGTLSISGGVLRMTTRQTINRRMTGQGFRFELDDTITAENG